jgi:hypothetical protein
MAVGAWSVGARIFLSRREPGDYMREESAGQQENPGSDHKTKERGMILWLHPVLMQGAILLGWFVLFLGLLRASVLHFKQKMNFPWKRHVTLGTIVFGIFLGGMVAGSLAVFWRFNEVYLFSQHADTALLMVPFILFGLASGWYLDRVKRKRFLLPVLHGANNIAVLLLAGRQIWTGWNILKGILL